MLLILHVQHSCQGRKHQEILRTTNATLHNELILLKTNVVHGKKLVLEQYMWLKMFLLFSLPILDMTAKILQAQAVNAAIWANISYATSAFGHTSHRKYPSR